MPISVEQGFAARPAQQAGGAQAARRVQEGTGRKAPDAEELRAKQKALHDQLLQLRSGTDGAAATEETQKALEEKLERISAQLRTAAPAAGGPEAPAARSSRFDEYVQAPEDRASPGVYAVSHDEAGRHISFAPYSEGGEAAEAAPEQAGDGQNPSDEAQGPAPAEEKGERCTVNTDRVDGELQRLRRDRDELERQTAQAEQTGGPEAEQLRQRLDALEAELRQKDNDAYRRQHATYFNE